MKSEKGLQATLPCLGMRPTQGITQIVEGSMIPLDEQHDQARCDLGTRKVTL